MVTIEDRARVLQLAVAKGSWNEGFELIAEALREERRAAFLRAAEIVQQAQGDWNYQVASNASRAIFAEAEKEHPEPEQDDSALPTAEDVRGIMR